MSQICDLHLERPSGVYYAGETVNGQIYLTLPERALIKAIALESNGYACSSWLKPQKQKKQKSRGKPQVLKPPIAFGQRVDYFAKVDYFVGSEAALPQLMAAGAYRYDFSVQLPQSCPSSYEGAHGHIRYTLQLSLQRSAELPPEPALTLRLQLLQRCELNQQPGQLLTPCEVTALEQTPSLKFWQRPLQLQLDIPRTGYEPGMGISVHVRLHNAQQLPLKAIIYKLNLVSTHVGWQQDKPKHVASQVERRYLVSSSHQLNTCPRNELLNFQHLHTLQVPQTPPSLSAAACACLQLSYEVEVLVQTNLPDRFIAAQLPIIIYQTPTMQAGLKQDPGTSRSLGELQAVGVAGASTRTPEAGNFATAAPNLSASMSSLASKFREAEFMVATNLNRDKHAMSGEQIDFRPRYLYYEMDHAETEKVL
ncbi:arrestin domain-containing protein 17 [Drosophila novamexicana]|uniref:arrestin domain-containing protein 17 n=1 Tax=Drosophila novamexicana TaxID=47314 RepID=UPI0011E58B74|nr:arrestin domain-containing protein 17 [Drosophila novamexicana]